MKNTSLPDGVVLPSAEPVAERPSEMADTVPFSHS